MVCMRVLQTVQNNFISRHVEACVTTGENAITLAPDMQDVRDAVFAMNAPGPDGFEASV